MRRRTRVRFSVPRRVFYSQQTRMLMKHGAAAFGIPATGKHKVVGAADAGGGGSGVDGADG